MNGSAPNWSKTGSQTRVTKKCNPNLCRAKAEPRHSSKISSSVTTTTDAANKNVISRAISSPSRSRLRNDREPRFGLAVVSEPAARGRRNRAADYVFVCGVGSCGHAAADLRAMAGLRFGAAQVWIAFFCDPRLGSGLRPVRGASVHLRHLGDGNGGAGNCGAAGNRSGHFSGGTGAGESVGHAGVFHRPAGGGAERDLRLAGSVYRGAADAGLRATGAEEDAGIFAAVLWARIRGGLFDSRGRAGDHDHSLHYFGVA